MYHLALTLETPAANLALDEALLEAAEAGELPGEVLRTWEPAQYFVVLGRSSSPLAEVHEAACRADCTNVFRRVSGGAAVAVGPGCLMYALVLDCTQRPELRGVDRAHQLVLGRLATALGRVSPAVSRAGVSDVVLRASPDGEARKFSGNSVRLKRDYLLYHGTILYDFELERIERWLASPRQEPAYRQGRGHADFVVNLPAKRAEIVAALANEWQAGLPLDAWPRERTASLVTSRYGKGVW